MSRIEEALAKLQIQQRASAELAAPARKPIAQVREGAEPAQPAEPRQHAYRGKHIEIDFEELKTQGLLAPGSDARKLAEEYRILKRPLVKTASSVRAPLLPRANLLLVASAMAHEGKTFTCINLCLSLAKEKDWSVVLVDADSKKPHLTRLFGAENEPGLMDVLRDPGTSFDSVVMPTNVPGFSLMPSGTYDEHASELLASGGMNSLCEEVSRANPQRFVVFDSAPLLLTSETVALSAHVGQIVLVVHAGHTPQRAVLSARDLLDPEKAITLLLNQAHAGSDAYNYGQYGQYGHDGGQPG